MIPKEEFTYRLKNATSNLLSLTRSLVVNSISRNIEYLIVPNSREVSEHLNDWELKKLHALNAMGESPLKFEEVVATLLDEGLTPLWVNMEVCFSSRKTTHIKLICSRRYRSEADLFQSVDRFPPFHPLVPLPPWHKEGVRFDINWQHQWLRKKWHAWVFKLKNKRP